MNKKNKKFSANKLRFTDHFIERYHQRIINKIPDSYSGRIHSNKQYSRKAVRKDIRRRLTHYEKQSINLLVGCNKKVSIPLGMTNTMIIKNGIFVTIY